MKSIFTIIFVLIHTLSFSDAVFGADNKNEMQKNVPNAPDKVQPLLIGSAVPEVNLKNIEGDTVRLHKLVLKKPSILIFYRGSWCMYCNLHFSKLRQVEPNLIQLGYQIVAISPDRPKKLKNTVAKHKMGYILLSDSRMEAARSFGIAFHLDNKIAEKYISYGIDLIDASGQNHQTLPVPSVFIVDQNGIIQFQYINPNHKVRLNPSVLLALAEAALPGNNTK